MDIKAQPEAMQHVIERKKVAEFDHTAESASSNQWAEPVSVKQASERPLPLVNAKLTPTGAGSGVGAAELPVECGMGSRTAGCGMGTAQLPARAARILRPSTRIQLDLPSIMRSVHPTRPSLYHEVCEATFHTEARGAH